MLSFVKKYWYNSLIFTSIAAGIVYFSLKEYFVSAVLIFVSPILLFIPKKIAFWNQVAKSSRFTSTLKALAAIIFILSLLGSAYFYRVLSFYDGLTHIAVSLAICLIIAISLSIGWPIKNGFSKALFQKKEISFKKLAIASLLITVILGLFWELFEKTSDTYFGTHLFKDYFDPIAVDTIEDIIGDFIGGLLGGLYIYLKGAAWKKDLIEEK